MKKTLLTLAAVLVVSPLAAQPETLSLSAAARFNAAALTLPAFKFAAASPAELALRAAGIQARQITVLDIENLFNAGSKIAKADVNGWFSGRRYGAKGASAQLLVGTDVLRDADSGPLGGSDFKLASFGGNEPGVVPTDLYDAPGSETVNATEYFVRENGAQWAAADFTETGARGQDSWSAFEVRKNGNLLVAKYADGSYAYFFKRVW